MVVLHHCACAGLYPFAHDSIFHDGGFAVRIFWIMSAFVLGAGLLDRENRVRATVSAALRRYPRLMLPCVCSCLLAWVLLAAGLMMNHSPALMQTEWLARHYQFEPSAWRAIVSGFTFLKGFIYKFIGTTFDDYNAVLWTMRGELFGSFLIFLLSAVSGKLRLALTVALTVTSFFWAFASSNNNNDWLLCFMLGFWLLLAIRRGFARLTVSGMRGTVVALCGVLAVLVLRRYNFTLAAGTLVWCVCFSPQLQKLLAVQPAVWLGKISFGVYLLHMCVLFSVGFGAAILLKNFGHAAQAWACTLVTVSVSLLVAGPFEKFIDRPSIAASKFFARKILAFFSRPRR